VNEFSDMQLGSLTVRHDGAVAMTWNTSTLYTVDEGEKCRIIGTLVGNIQRRRHKNTTLM